MDESFNQYSLDFFTLFEFHTTAAIRVIDQTPAGLLLMTFPDGEYPVTFQSPKIRDGRFLQ
jgi:hypothetical protein